MSIKADLKNMETRILWQLSI